MTNFKAVGSWNQTQFKIACKNGDLIKVQKLVHLDGVNPTCPDCFIWACQSCNASLVSFLINLGAKAKSECAIMWSVALECLPVVQTLIEASSDNLHYALTSACGINKSKIAKFLISTYSYLSFDKNLMLSLSAKSGMLDVVKLLLDYGSNPNEGMHHACSQGHFKIVQLLIKRGAEVKDNLLTVACRQKEYEVVNYLVYKGAKVSSLSPYLRNNLNVFNVKLDNIKKRAQKILYFWWIPICYDHNRECGKRMMQKSWINFNKLNN